MARQFLTPIDLGKNEIRNAVMQNLGSAPSSPANGQLYYDTALHQLLVWNSNDSAWELIATNALLLQGQNGAYYLARSNATGTQTSSTISDLAAVVQAYRLDQFAAPGAN